jgi:hypothetical protein
MIDIQEVLVIHDTLIVQFGGSNPRNTPTSEVPPPTSEHRQPNSEQWQASV